MVSMQTWLFQKEKCSYCPSLDQTSKKRKRGGDEEDGNNVVVRGPVKELNLWCSAPAVADIDLPLEDPPLPPEWQRCLDIKSGEIHFYNTRTRERTSRDPRRSLEPSTTPPPMSLDLELNLRCESPVVHKDEHQKQQEHDKKKKQELEHLLHSDRPNKATVSWVSLGTDRSEMVAAVCMRCHLLVMMCKSSPSCPNCKYLHPLDHGGSASAALFKSGLSRLLCCKDY